MWMEELISERRQECSGHARLPERIRRGRERAGSEAALHARKALVSRQARTYSTSPEEIITYCPAAMQHDSNPAMFSLTQANVANLFSDHACMWPDPSSAHPRPQAHFTSPLCSGRPRIHSLDGGLSLPFRITQACRSTDGEPEQRPIILPCQR